MGVVDTAIEKIKDQLREAGFSDEQIEAEFRTNPALADLVEKAESPPGEFLFDPTGPQRRGAERQFGERQELLRRNLALAEQTFAELAPLRQAGLGALSQFQAQPLGIFRTGGEPGELFRPPPIPPGQQTMGGLGLFGGGGGVPGPGPAPGPPPGTGQQLRQQLQMGGLGQFINPELRQRVQQRIANRGPIPAS